jgi:hypothetical protein
MSYVPIVCLSFTAFASGVQALAAVPVAPLQSIPPDAKYACPMEAHPDRENPEEQGAYFSTGPGTCPWCGMKLKPLDELAWARVLRAAEGAEVAYTCPEHQQVFSRAAGKCPRCGKALQPFKVMYTCPNPEHASVIHLRSGTCPEDGRALVPFRGVWLSEKMAAHNAPPKPALADQAAYRCPIHPLVHSAQPGRCTICAGKLQRTDGSAFRPISEVPSDANYVCPMEECHYFATEPGECPKCGMAVKPIEQVQWARGLKRTPAAPIAGDQYVCPMHPQERSGRPGRCNICGMQLVEAKNLPQPKTAPEAVQVQMNYLMEHYLQLQQRFASDRTKGAAQQALGMIAAADELEKLLNKPGVDLPPEFGAALIELRDAAVKLRSEKLAAGRVAFVDLSAALRTMVEQARPSREKYGRIYIFHCPMTKGDWLQASEEMANPYYGFEMLKCGELVATE